MLQVRYEVSQYEVVECLERVTWLLNLVSMLVFSHCCSNRGVQHVCVRTQLCSVLYGSVIARSLSLQQYDSTNNNRFFCMTVPQ